MAEDTHAERGRNVHLHLQRFQECHLPALADSRKCDLQARRTPLLELLQCACSPLPDLLYFVAVRDLGERCHDFLDGVVTESRIKRLPLSADNGVGLFTWLEFGSRFFEYVVYPETGRVLQGGKALQHSGEATGLDVVCRETVFADVQGRVSVLRMCVVKQYTYNTARPLIVAPVKPRYVPISPSTRERKKLAPTSGE